MRQLLMAVILILPVYSSARAASADAVVFDLAVQSKCTKPDNALIKSGTSDKYNAQAKGFNDCLRVYVENENNKIARIRQEASAAFDRIMESATSQIRDIESAINSAIFEVAIVNGLAEAQYQPPPGNTLASFPAASCNKPDAVLLKPAPGKRVASLKNADRYEEQRLAYETCMRSYIAQAKNQIRQVKANAETAFHQVAEDANPRITQINNDVTEALNNASKAAGERDAAVNAFHAPLSSDGLSPEARARLITTVKFQPPQTQTEQDQPGTESVIVPGERLPRSADMPTGAGDPGAISCRKPQPLSDSRLMGPEICKRNREWARLFKDGQNISSDGLRVVPSEKQRTFDPQTCVSHTQYVNGVLQVMTYCSQGDR